MVSQFSLDVPNFLKSLRPFFSLLLFELHVLDLYCLDISKLLLNIIPHGLHCLSQSPKLGFYFGPFGTVGSHHPTIQWVNNIQEEFLFSCLEEATLICQEAERCVLTVELLCIKP